jgi:hypothetical protein
MKAKNFLYFLFIILLAGMVFAADPGAIEGVQCTNTPILEDRFNYSSAYTSNGWDLFSTCTFAPIPPNTPYNSASFGFNGSYCQTDYFHNVRWFDAADRTTGTWIISFDITQNFDNKTSAGNPSWWHRVTDKDSNIKAEIEIGRNDDLADHEIFGCAPSFTFTEGVPAHVDIIMNLDTDRTSVYINNLSYGCANLNTTIDELGGFQLNHFHSSYEGTDRQTDNVVICQGQLLGNSSLDTSDDEDLVVAVDSFWDTFGVKSSVSRMVFGLFLMFVLAVLFFEAHVVSKTPITPGSGVLLVIIEFVFSIMLVFLQLFPVWLVILYGFIAGGIAFLVFKSTMSSG